MIKLLVFLKIPIISFASPSWLYNIKDNKNCEIIGYGIGDTLDKAKQGAMSDIVRSISVSVRSDIDISTSDNDGDVSQNSSINIKTKSQATLSGVEFIKVEEENGLWYVAAKYDNSSIDMKLKKLLPVNLKDETQNNYLKTTPLITELNKFIGKKLNYKIVRKDNLWQLKYKDILLPLNKNNFYKLFSNTNNSQLSIISNQKIYKENDEMYFKINHKKPGYISILYIEHNGKVGVLQTNYESKKSFMYPDLKSEDTFKIANPYGKTIMELYVLIHSKKPIDLHEFEDVSDSLLDESNYNFDKLISRLDDLEFSTYMIKIRK